MDELTTKLGAIFKGELDDSNETREFYSHDASFFELKPEVVGFPKDSRRPQERRQIRQSSPQRPP